MSLYRMLQEHVRTVYERSDQRVLIMAIVSFLNKQKIITSVQLNTQIKLARLFQH